VVGSREYGNEPPDSRLAEKLKASQTRLCSMEIIRKQRLHGGVLTHHTLK
jgi:hypothetical protein